jgi:hypothetical protein
MGPNKRAQERERAAARAAAEAKRAEAEQQGESPMAEDRRHLERAPSRWAGIVVLSNDRRGYRGRAPMAQLLVPRLRPGVSIPQSHSVSLMPAGLDGRVAIAE